MSICYVNGIYNDMIGMCKKNDKAIFYKGFIEK